MKIIAEIGSNWTDVKSAFHMIDLAASCGANVVKFQDFAPIEEFNRPDWWKAKNKRWQVAPHLPALRRYAIGKELEFLTSVFTPAAVNRAIINDGVKIASSEIGNRELLLTIAQAFGRDCNRPVYLSVPHTATPLDLMFAIAWLRECRVIPLYCVAEYPAQDARIDALIGWSHSQHSFGLSSHYPYPLILQVAGSAKQLGASVIEMHLRAHETAEECPDNGPWSLYPEEFTEVVKLLKS